MAGELRAASYFPSVRALAGPKKGARQALSPPKPCLSVAAACLIYATMF